MIARETDRGWFPHDRNRLMRCGRGESGNSAALVGETPGTRGGLRSVGRRIECRMVVEGIQQGKGRDVA